jgi:hypothetical protein
VTWPQPTRQHHDRFCGVEGWTRVRDARGRSRTHHVTYELGLLDGRVLRTRISQPVDRGTYGPGIWKHILRDQLDVSEREFWACVRDGTRPPRSAPEAPPEALPADLVQLLITRVGLAEVDVAAMTRAEAVEHLNRYWVRGG